MPNTEAVLLASLARSTTQTSDDLNNPSCSGIRVILKVTSAGTGSITLTINGRDPASGAYHLLLSGAAVTTNSTNTYTVFPGATASANVAANDCLPETFQIVVTANNANSITYSVGYQLLRPAN